MLFRNKKKKVDFVIIGAQKCGTTSLFQYLKAHPSLQGSLGKELDYFHLHSNYKMGEKWYHSRWKDFGKKDILYYEASPQYWYSPHTPERIAKYNPEMKFICLVRDPVIRAYSAYNMFKQNTLTPELRERTIEWSYKNRNPDIENFFQKLFFTPEGCPPFENFLEEEMKIMSDAKQLPEPSFIRRGFYQDQLENFYNYFPKDRFILFENIELDQERSRVLNEICSFVGVPQMEWNIESVNSKYHVIDYKEPMSKSTFNMLSELYKPHNEAFFSHIGKKFNWS